MFKRSRTACFFTILLGVSSHVAACKQDSQSASTSPNPTAAANAVAAALPKDGPSAGVVRPKSTGPVSVERFEAEVVGAVCQGLRTCQNHEQTDRIAQAIGMIVLAHRPGGFDESPYLERFDSDLEILRTHAWDLKREACERLLTYGVKEFGIDGSALERSVTLEHIHYDPSAARKCVAALTFEDLALCRTKTDVKARAETDRADPTEGSPSTAGGVAMSFEDFSREVGTSFIPGVDPSVWKHLESCESVMSGRLKEDDVCFQTYDCASGLSCVSEDDKTGVKRCKKAESSDVFEINEGS
ncbi:MAG: hypothetical protein H6729_12400 [Deltaproteobacteria bacterium]|nr:hypothetical protein [Deltaproteobacteria bacterium]